jgi:hypothetical protein
MADPLPFRAQFELLTYDGHLAHPVLFLQPGDPFDHLGLFRVLASAGLALPAPWEWRGGLWPFSVTCELELTGDPATAVILANGRPVPAGRPPAGWTSAAAARRRALLVLLPPAEDRGGIGEFAELTRQTRRGACLAGSVAAVQRGGRCR